MLELDPILEQTPGIPQQTTIKYILEHQCIPGPSGVLLEQRSVAFGDLWEITRLIKVEVSLTKDLIDGHVHFRLRSGSRKQSPITKPIFGLMRIIAHTHPSGALQRLPSFQDIELLNHLFLHQIRARADAIVPHSRVIYGPGFNDYTIFWPSLLR